MADRIDSNILRDGIDRRGFLKCMAWAGTGVIWTLCGGVPRSFGLDAPHRTIEAANADLVFAQISDSHIGFTKDANPDVVGTLRTAVARLNGLPTPPAFVLHTGDISHLSKPTEFDTADQVLKEVKTDRIIYVPGEHDVLSDNGKSYLERYGKGALGDGWRSFNHKGVHFIGLVNVRNLKAGGMGSLGPEQLAWLENDVKHLRSDTPVVVFAHIPLWSVYPEWGWGTDDSAQALTFLKRFGSVTVLNGHIHQTMQKVEGNIVFHTAASTAFPQPQPGKAPSPGPMKVDAGKLNSLLGVTSVAYKKGEHALAVVDSSLDSAVGAAAQSGAAVPVAIDNFSFLPRTLTVTVGSTVTWTNRDDVPHTVVSTDKRFSSPALDTDEKFSHRFDRPGSYDYYCSVHPHMTATVVVKA